ncbi:hypothetical protein DBB33_12480 [Chromobacterium haemolyticum]|nr:hypothetical protein DBB33_12480 [Chromobacterium haemolyticum]
MAGCAANTIPARGIRPPTSSGFEHPAALSKGAKSKMLLGGRHGQDRHPPRGASRPQASSCRPIPFQTIARGAAPGDVPSTAASNAVHRRTVPGGFVEPAGGEV